MTLDAFLRTFSETLPHGSFIAFGIALIGGIVASAV